MRRHQQFLAIALVLAHLLLALAYSSLVPLGEAPDEADHWYYIVYLARQRRLPVGPTITQSKHPPLYHATAAAVAGLAAPSFDFLRANPDVQMRPAPDRSLNFFVHTSLETWPWRDGPLAFHLARLWSVFLSTCTVAATYGLVRAAFPERIDLALAVTGVLAFLPEFAFIGGVVNNDNAAALFGTLALWGGFAIYRGDGRLRPGWWTPLALGLGLLSKVSTLALWPAVGMLVLLAGGRWRRVMGLGTAVFTPALLIAGPWFARNWLLYGDPLGLELARQTVDRRLAPWTWADTLWLLRGWFVSFWGKFGGAGHIPMPGWIYAALGGLTLLSGAGLVRMALDRGWRWGRTALALLALAAGATMLVIWRYSLMALGTDQGRLLYPAVAPLVTLFVAGLLAWAPARCPEKIATNCTNYTNEDKPLRSSRLRSSILIPLAYSQWQAAALWVLLSGVLGVYALFGVVRPAFAPPPSPSDDTLAALTAVEPLDFGELSLFAWRLDGDPVLYWQAEQQPTQDWRIVLRVVAEDGSLAWEWRRSPGRGRWSSDRWPPGTAVRDAYEVRWPEWAGPGRYRVEVGVQPFGAGPVAPIQGGEPAAAPEHPYAFLGWLLR